MSQSRSATSNQRFGRVVIVRNPRSTRAQDEFGLVDQLRQTFVANHVHELKIGSEVDEADTWIRTAAAKRWLAPNTLLAVLGGDGTLNHVVGSLLDDPTLTPKQRQVVILPLWGGNANDLARMLNGMPGRPRIQAALKQGKVVKVRPIAFTLTPRRGKVEHRRALCYASFGASAAVAQIINGGSFRHGTRRTFPVFRFARELALVIKTLRAASRFTIREGSDQRERRIFERVFLNGPRLAKVERIALRLTDEYFYETSVTRMRLGALFARALELSDRRFSNKVAQTYVSFVAEDGVLAQFDGEDEAIRAGTRIEAQVAEQPFYALSLRLK